MTIQYRRATPEDFSAIVDLFVVNMNLSVFTSATDKRVLKQLATLFLAKDCHHATFIQVAEYGDIICGVVIGVTKQDPHKALSFDEKPIIDQIEKKLSLSEQGQQVLKELREPETADTKWKNNNFDSELQFFCVDPNYRRHRIGATLIQAFETYLIAQGADTYALHTDTLCTYQYYDNNGYQRVNQYPNDLNPQIMHYTYVKSLS
ncbi:GNAT family N-acetyltransferase [Psychrobacter fozii]|uniref:Acetyltransferase (GNAT) family protein n=1 Tax=Psychrobacter fozii TaxID=198480 RepID=A0A2V4UQ06_9GAMM|nr:GNAT family N-acetyltransferase [Psychrobacter fozii]PYE38626.1 acetyltransferase (GNAT) family protein [Psychrobacter fozii]